MSATYRFRQFVAAVKARVEPEEMVPVDEYLNPAEQRLFRAMEIQDQRHTLNVFHDLRRSGCDDRALLQAGLLHDVGKANVGLGTWSRVAIVLVKALRPGLLDVLASQNERSWRYPLWVHRHHGGIGAQLLRQAGSSPRVVELTLGHHSPSTDPLAQALWLADGRN